MKKIFLFILFIFISLAGSGQLDNNNSISKDSLRSLPKIFLSINAGWNGPFGVYQEASSYPAYDYPYMGFAQNGDYYSVLAGIAFKNSGWEPQLLFSNEWNSIDIPHFISTNTPFHIYNNLSIKWPDGPTYSATYVFYNAMPGIAWAFKNKYLSFDLKFMLGYTYRQFPTIQRYVADSNGIKLMTLHSASSSSYANDFGIGLKIFITPNIIAMINADIFIGSDKLTFDIPVTFDKPTEVSFDYGATHQTVTAFTWHDANTTVMQANISFGVGYAFTYSRNK